MSELFREGLRRLEQEEQQQRAQTATQSALGDILRATQQSAKAAGLDRMNDSEINEEISAARKDMQARAKKPANKPSRG